MSVVTLFKIAPARVAALAAIGALAALALTAGPLADRANAATVDVNTGAAFVAAVNDATEDLTVNITGSFTINGSDGSAQVTPGDAINVIINGNNHVIDCGSACSPLIQASTGSAYTVTINDLTIADFPMGAVEITNTNLVMNNSIFAENFKDASEDDDELFLGAGALYVNNAGDPVPEEDWDTDGRTWANTTLNNVDFDSNRVAVGFGAAWAGAAEIISDLTMTGCEVSNNSVDVLDDALGADAGAFIIASSAFYVADCVFENNHVGTPDDDDAYGGVFSIYDSEGSIEESTFTENHSSGSGGAVAVNQNSDVEFNEVEFTSNFAEDSGGAIVVQSGASARMWYSTFESNQATNRGGAISANLADADIANSTFEENESWQRGGAVDYTNEANGRVTSSLFTDNNSGSGGAIAMDEASEVNVDNSTITDNDAVEGAAIAVQLADVDLYFLTITGNTPDNGRGQLLTQGTDTRLFGTIITDNGSGGGNCVAEEAEFGSADYNFVDDASCDLGGSNDVESTDADPQLDDLQFYGGPTDVMPPDPSSPVVDVIPSGVGACFPADSPRDQRGVSRPWDGDGDEDSLCDIGAVEIFKPIQGVLNTPGGDVYVRILNSTGAEGGPVDLSSYTPAPPAGVAFPYGGLSLGIEVYASGWPVDIEIGTPAPTTTLVKLFEDAWSTPPTAVSVPADGGTLWSFRVIDNGYGDNESETSLIEDPIALGAAASFAG